MVLPAGSTGHLDVLAQAAGGGFALSTDLEDLLRLAVRAVPSCLAVSVTLERNDLPVTVTAFAPSALLDPVRASLSLRLPGRAAHGGAGDTTGTGGASGHGPALLVLYAGDVGAWAQPAADLVALLDLDPRRAIVDAHLELPPLAAGSDVLAAQLDDVSAVDRAVGVLLDRGMLPAEGHRELRRLATAGGTTVATSARALLTGLRPPAGRPRR